MQALLLSILISIIVFLFIKPKIGIALYLAYFFLVPFLNINFAGINLQWNLFNILVILISINEVSKSGEGKYDLKPFYPFLILYSFLLFEMIFQTETPYSFMFDSWRIYIFSLFLPIAIWNIGKSDYKNYIIFKNITIICIIIALGYELFLTTQPGTNPYVFLLKQINNMDTQEEYAAVVDGRIFGRISSVFAHPMTYGIFLCLSVVYVFSQFQSTGKRYLILLILLLVGVLVCGIRSPIAAILVSACYYLLIKRKIKYFIIAAISGFIILSIINTIPEISIAVNSMFTDDTSEISGSSPDMRLDQLNGCFDEIRNSSIFGKGLGWHTYYMRLHGDHPVIAAFESLLYVVICDYGFVGIAIYFFAYFKLFIYIKKKIKNTYSSNIQMLTVIYLAYAIITGDYGYIRYYLVFYSIMMLDAYYYKLPTINDKKKEKKIK